MGGGGKLEKQVKSNQKMIFIQTIYICIFKNGHLRCAISTKIPLPDGKFYMCTIKNSLFL